MFFWFKNFLLDLFFPKTCVGCENNGTYLCDRCFLTIKILKNQKCPNCKRSNLFGKFCNLNCSKNFYFDQLLVCTDYQNDTVKKLIKTFKYRFVKELIPCFYNVFFTFLNYFKNYFSNKNIIVVPVPIYSRKFNERGFNQSELISKLVINIFKNFKFCDCLIKTESLTAQAKLRKKERLENLKGSVSFNPNFKDKIENQFILLIDDIVTTGSTLNECSKILKINGAKYICCLTFASGM